MLRLPLLSVLSRKEMDVCVCGRGRWTMVEVEETPPWQVGRIFDEGMALSADSADCFYSSHQQPY
jgi:hypothetical protein